MSTWLLNHVHSLLIGRTLLVSKTIASIYASCTCIRRNQSYLHINLHGVKSINTSEGTRQDVLVTCLCQKKKLYGKLRICEIGHLQRRQYSLNTRTASPLQRKRMNPPNCFNGCSSSLDRHVAVQVAYKQNVHRAFVAFGSNIGDRLQFIEDAIRRLAAHGQIRVLKTSGIWETRAMYFLDQADFLNGVCEIETDLEPLPLLDALQAIERSLNRVKVIEKGPRTIDLDILLYDDVEVEHERLIIPHKLMLERPFVLYPLSELLHLDHPIAVTRGGVKKSITIRECISELPRNDNSSQEPSLVAPIASTATSESPLILRPLQSTRVTQLMAIVNLTPDSFSDGGEHPSGDSDLDVLASTVIAHLRCGASIIDVGGQSSRPGAGPVSAEEEISRVVPIIAHLHALSNSTDWPSDIAKPIISIDTYRAPVAQAAVQAGATVVNDISGGYLDPGMLPCIASLFHEHRMQCSIVLMHMRGDPQTMSRSPHIMYPESSDDNVSDQNGASGMIAAIASELAERVQAAQEAGIPRWRILLDPGVGFAKVGEQNCELLRSLSSLRFRPSSMSPQALRQQPHYQTSLAGIPWVVGPSRKKFIGTLSDNLEADYSSGQNGDGSSSRRKKKMEERAWGTAAAVSASIAGGADIVRIHDVAEMKRVVSVADAIWRR